jgi:hypothetical protein
MAINNLSLPDGSSQRISFAHASSLLLAQALTDANERRMRHFPTLSSAIWGDMLQQLQPDVLVTGEAVTFDWLSLTHRVQGLVLDPGMPAIFPPADGPLAAESDAQLKTYHWQAVPALAELQAIPQACCPLTYSLLTQLARGHAMAARVDDEIQRECQYPANTLCPSVSEPLVPLPNPAEATVNLQEEKMQKPGLVQTQSRTMQETALGPVPRRKATKRYTFRSIVEQHPRGNGKFGFTVRELCSTMHISAASLTEARKNPGHLSVEKVVALADAMGEHPLRVLLDLAKEAAAKKRRPRKKRVMQPQHPENSCWK